MTTKKKPSRVYKRTRVIITIQRLKTAVRYYDGERTSTSPTCYGTHDREKATVFYTKKAANVIINRMYEHLRKQAQIGWEESCGRGGAYSEEERECEETTITTENL